MKFLSEGQITASFLPSPFLSFCRKFQSRQNKKIRKNPLLIGEEAFSLDGLYELLTDRKAQLPEGSYTSYLFQKGIDKILKKVGEECTEVIVAGKGGERAETVYEIADLAYHVMVLMVEMGIRPEEIRRELASRHVIDHKVKQEKMA